MIDKFKDYSNLYTQVVSETIDHIDLLNMESFIKNMLGFKRIFLTARGRTSLILQSFAMRLVHLEKSAHWVGHPTTPRITKNDCLLVASGSGKTDGLILITEKARKEGVSIFVISYQEISALSKLADHLLILPIKLDKQEIKNKSKVFLGTLFEQALFLTLECMIGVMMALEEKTFEDLSSQHVILE